jgi:hypothetical protein
LKKVKESIALIVAEVVSRCLCELTFDLLNKSVSKMTLPLRVASIATNAANAASKITLGSNPHIIDQNAVKATIVEKCFPKQTSTATPPGTPAPSVVKNGNPSQNNLH